MKAQETLEVQLRVRKRLSLRLKIPGGTSRKENITNVMIRSGTAVSGLAAPSRQLIHIIRYVELTYETTSEHFRGLQKCKLPTFISSRLG